MNAPPPLKRIRESRLFWPLAALFIILLFDAIFVPSFFKIGVQDGHLYGNLIDVVNNGAPLMLVAIGMTMVIATGGVDLSVGAVIAISAAMGAVLINPALGDRLITNDILTKDATNTPLVIIVIANLLAGTLCGLWNGMLVSRARIQPMVATLILMVAGRGIAQLITNGQIMTIYYTPYFWFGNGFILGLPVSVYIVALVFIVASLIVRRTPIGLFVEAVGINPKATFYAGISEKNIKLMAYAFCGFCSAIAGLILSSYVHSADGNNNGLNYELDAILAVVMGGTLMSGGRFSLFGSIIGALVIWTFTLSMYALGVPDKALLAGRAVLVLIVILLYSDQSRRLLSRLFDRKGARHGATH
ncbi:ABC transporter permease [Oscillochloris sp. ZM17-4]|uniref:ABC transporter permease n=1 Tax=Oscillochloris sp. ZM17-4 TaxID=2866714 RepID=UPI001C733DE4|nr:ABC transporter permease [Oscillochloris sp. ZM17-4]MBX0331237.1 ABC transporter permease [Oscillochloris sp. ZM17-4]